MTVLLHAQSQAFTLSLNSIGHLLLHTAADTLKMLPFLFTAFLIIEFLEKHASSKINKIFIDSGKYGPLAGTFLGCIPQCGFSVLAANLYSGGIITLGTLIAVFLSTSDEALILMAASPDAIKDIVFLLICKILIALAFGYAIDFLGKKFLKLKSPVSDLCEHDHCGCDDNEGIFKPAVIHTAKVTGFLFLVTLVLNFSVELLGSEGLSRILLSNSVFQPFLAALIGFIPNCSASVIITKLYLEGALSFGSVIAGLCTNAGAGLLVLFREKSRVKDNIRILAILYLCAIIPGVILHIFTLI